MDTATEDPLEALLASLRPEADRGRSALVSGGSSRARRALNARAVERLAGEGALTVRCGFVEGASLADTVAGAVEDALEAARAPGGLYDDRGDAALRALGGWLFRARSVGLQGLVLVLDEVDAWCDARGATPGNAATLGALLAEVPRRALSVLATAGAGQAAGTPALASALVDRFGALRVLGPVPTVQRDPGLLAAELAGRSCSLPALQRALPGWLRLPPEGPREDTLVVFTAPLGAPHLDAPEVPWVPSTGAPEAPEGPPRRPEDPRRWLRAVTSGAALQSLLRRLEEPLEETVPGLERAFREGAGKVPLALEGFRAGARTVGYRPRALGAVEAALGRFEAHFQALRPRLPAEGLGAPARLSALPGVLGAFAGACGARSALFVLCTGLREDLYGALRERVLPRLSGLRLVDQGFHWAEGAAASSPVVPREGSPGVFQRGHLGGVEVLQTALCAEGLAASGGSLEGALERLEGPLLEGLRALKGGAEARAALLFTGDRGDPLGRAVGETAFEVLVPYGLFTWDGRR